MVYRYGVPLMLTEIGMLWDNADAYNIVKDMVNKVGKINGGKGLGIFYWEPKAFPSRYGYSLDGVDNNYKATHLWEAFK